MTQQELVGMQAEQREALLEEQQMAQEEAEAEQEAFWEDVADTIDSDNEFAGIIIPIQINKTSLTTYQRP